jgi:hypothetical protein
MVLRNIMVAGVAAILVACADATPTALPISDEAGLAKAGGGGGTSVYKVRFVVGLIGEGDGEITTDWFPPAGINISTNNPWRQFSVSNVTLDLNNTTHGDFTKGQCAIALANFGLDYNISNWDIVGMDPVRSYAGRWAGTVTISKGYLAFDGDRVVNGFVTPDSGGIHNVVTQSNPVVESADPQKNWFRQEFRDAPLKFCSASTPDGAPLPNAEFACTNFTIELRKASTIQQ